MPHSPNILVITLDSLRPDHLGCYGYRGSETPNFDRLAAAGARFTAAYCQAPNTWMSHAALFTGCNPPRSGVRSPLGKLNSEQPTLAEVLKEAGYATFGLPSVSLLSREAGFARGFDEYPLEGLLTEFHGAAHFRDLAESLRLLRNWLTGARVPWFAWLHYFGIHVMQGVRVGSEAASQGRDAGVAARKSHDAAFDFPEEYRRRYSPFAQFYDGKIAYADHEFLAPALEIVLAQAAEENLAVVLLSDHGEDLKAVEAGLPGHDRALSEGELRVPLVVWAPGRVPEGAVVKSPVRLIDLFPTLMEVAEVPLAPNRIEGMSLSPLWKGVEAGPRDVYVENLYQGRVGLRRGRHKLVLSRVGRETFYRRHVAWRFERLCTALAPDRLLRPLRDWRRQRQDRQRFQSSAEVLFEQLVTGDADAHLFDLDADPDERHNFASQHPDVVNSLREQIREIGMAHATPTSPYTPEEEAEIEERLRDLGYL